jgi:hypothetical protein
MSPSERATLAVKLAGGLGNDSATETESVARLIVALGASMKPVSGFSESGVRGKPDSTASGGAAMVTVTPAPTPQRRSHGGVIALALVALLGVVAVFGARKLVQGDPPPASPAVQPTVAATTAPSTTASETAKVAPIATPSASSAAPVASQVAPDPKKLPDPKKKIVIGKNGTAASGEARVDDGF